MIFCIVGPTGVGKSSLAIEYGLKHNCQIINGDAFQCYKEMNIGTAKPSLEERSLLPHHLFDIQSIDVEYTIFDYQRDLRNKLDQLLKSNNDIIIVGGSGLYLKSALYDFTLNEVSSHVDMSAFEEYDNDRLYNYLQEIDPDESLKIHKNNRKRVLRAIQIFLESGKKKSEIIASQEHKMLYDVTFIGLSKNTREELYDLINKRVDLMFDQGLVSEVEDLLKNHRSDLRAFQAIGYKELIDAINNHTSIDEAKELIKKRTRNYAKRQYTYFNNQLNVNWFNSKEEAIAFMEKMRRGEDGTK